MKVYIYRYFCNNSSVQSNFTIDAFLFKPTFVMTATAQNVQTDNNIEGD